MKTLKVKFYCNEYESDIYEYTYGKNGDYSTKEEAIEIMENDRNDWTFSVIDTGYILIK